MKIYINRKEYAAISEAVELIKRLAVPLGIPKHEKTKLELESIMDKWQRGNMFN